MKSKFGSSNVLLVLAMGVLTSAIACGGGVKGNTYVDNGNVVQIEFKSDGKAYMSMGPVMDDDGGLNGPPGGMVSRLTKKK